MNENLTLNRLPNLPQIDTFSTLATKLWKRDDILALWLGGSFATGKADRYSDVDLRIAVSQEAMSYWAAPDFNDLFDGQLLLSKTSTTKIDASDDLAVLHHPILTNGEMYDVWVQTPTHKLHQEPKLVLGCRDITLVQKLAEPSYEPRLEFDEVNPAVLQGAIEQYWVNHLKNQKVIYRNLHMLWRDGSYLFGGIWLRLKFILATGKDCGNVTFPPMTIHKVTPVIMTLHEAYGDSLLETISSASRNQIETIAAVERLSMAIAQDGRAVAHRFGFEYPAEIETAVLNSWAGFKEREGF